MSEWRRLSFRVAAVATLTALHVASAKPAVRGQRPAVLDEPVEAFDNAGKALVPTLQDIAVAYHVPMGIEKVTPAALSIGLQIHLGRGTLAALLDQCVSQLPDYAWKVEEGAVFVYGPNEIANVANLFSMRIEDFSVVNETLNDANNRLRRLVFSAPAPSTSSSPARAVGVGGDSPGIGGLEQKRFDFKMKNASVREILSRIVALSAAGGQSVLWIANASPDHLDRAPTNGLWRLVPLGAPTMHERPSLK